MDNRCYRIIELWKIMKCWAIVMLVIVLINSVVSVASFHVIIFRTKLQNVQYIKTKKDFLFTDDVFWFLL